MKKPSKIHKALLKLPTTIDGKVMNIIKEDD